MTWSIVRKMMKMIFRSIEMETVKPHIDKETIANLPVEQFNGKIYVLLTEREAKSAVDYLLTQHIVGIDTETRPSFKKGKVNSIALLQVSTDNQCFLFRLCRMGIPDCIKKMLESKSLIKVGLSLKDDFLQLNRSERNKITPQAYIELQTEVKKIGIEDMSLQKIYANLFGKRISKRQQLSNWEADILSETQQIYAATDAWACLRIYNEIKRLIPPSDPPYGE